MVPELVDAIKSQGLALVVDRSAEAGAGAGTEADAARNHLPSVPKGVDGLLKNNGVLRFNESIDV